jgi:4-diphosphocytidyl-2-C-methyl-D-erythritol kinase
MIKKSLHVEKAYAKINLFLNVLNRRDDGYHNIDTIFQAIDLADQLTFSITLECGKADEIDFEINLDSDSQEVKSLGLNNSVTKAIEVFFTRVPQDQVIDLVKSVRIDIFIEKNIPLNAGLAGGSSDAAATLRALNKFFMENFDWSLNQKELAELALEIGSDVPFALVAPQAPRLRGFGRGELLVSIDKEFELNEFFDSFSQVILVKPEIGISTKVAYDLLSSTLAEEDDDIDGFYNKFESVIFDHFPELVDIQEDLYNLGASFVLMSGSGSTLIGFFDSSVHLDGIFEQALEFFPESKGFKVMKGEFLR